MEEKKILYLSSVYYIIATQIVFIKRFNYLQIFEFKYNIFSKSTNIICVLL